MALTEMLVEITIAKDKNVSTLAIFFISKKSLTH